MVVYIGLPMSPFRVLGINERTAKQGPLFPRGTNHALHVRACLLKSLRLFVLFYMIFKCLLRTDTLRSPICVTPQCTTHYLE